MSKPPPPTSPQRLHPLWEGRSLLLATGLLLTFCVLLLLVFKPRFIQQTELRLYDTMLSARTSPAKTPIPVMVGIDDESLQAYGQWPWPRYRLARLVQRLRELGADVIALDILMPEPDRTSPEINMAEREREFTSSPAVAMTARRDSNSRRLADVLAGGRTILGYYFNFSGADRERAPDLPVPPGGMAVSSVTTSGAEWPRPTGLLRSIPVLTAAAGAEGFTNAQHDIDGVLRRVPLLLRYRG